MPKTIYTEEQINSLEANAVLPDGVDLVPFAEMVSQLKEALGEFEELKRRGFGSAGFYHYQNKPRRKRQPKEVVGDDGWTEMIPKKHVPTAEEEAEAAWREEDVEQVRTFRTNTAKISSGKTGTADSKDTVAVSRVSRFNAFDALNADEDD